MDNSIQAHQKELCNKLWAMANALRGNMEAYEFKNYILGMIFYYYLSDKTEKYMVNLLKDDNISYEDAWNDEEYKAAIVEEALRDLGYIIEPEYLFRKMVKMVENRSFDIEFLQKAINALMESTIGNDSQEDFDGLFSDMQLDSTKLGHTVKDRSAVMAKIIASLDEINFSVDDTKIDVLGNAYEYLIGQFAATAGKKAGEFYTPSGPAELLCRLACLGLTDVKDAADPTCGSGSLLLRLKNYANVRNYYGQELTSTTYNLARMNMILRGIPYRNFNIYNGDTLEHDYFGDMKFRVQVANPPYSANWSADMHFMEDERFNEYGKLAPKSKADFAFVQHMVYHMDEDGRAVVLLPHGVLFRGAAEEVIRKHLIQKLNVLDAVIGLPANLFFGTGIPVCVLVLKRERNGNSDNILFIDASNDFEAGKNQNILRECDIDKIVETYEHRVDVDKYAHVATMQEIEENGFNLNIPRYVDTFEPEEDKIRIEDIAHALSMMTRANGHFPQFFSVGQHCIQCCHEATARNYLPQTALACLLHDGSEAYLADITRPVKKNMTMYLQIEEQLQHMIYTKFLGYVPEGEEAELITNIDDSCLYYEFLHFMDEKMYSVEPVMVSTPSYEFQPMADVEKEFLSLFEELKEKIREEESKK